MKKAIKVILCIIGGLVALIVALVATLPLWLGPVVKPSANTLVPKFTKTGFHLGVLSLNPYTGRFELGDMQLKNPEGFSEADAAAVGQIVVDVAMNTLSGEVVHIEEITIRDVFVSYVNAKGVNNFKQIQYNLAGGKEQYEAKQQAAANEPEPAASEEAQMRDEAEAELKELNKKRVVIDRLTISGLKVKLGFIPIALPDIELTDIGKQSNGATWAEVWTQIMEAVMKSIGAVGDGVKALGGALGDGAKAAGESAGKAIDAVGEGAGKAAEAFKSLFK